MTETKDKKPRKFSLRNVSLKKLNHKYDFLMSHDETGRPMLGFKLNLLNLVLVIIGMALLLIIITTFIIAFTPLREYIPGYTDTITLRKTKQDSILRAEYEAQNQFNLFGDDLMPAKTTHPVKNFFVPLTGNVTNSFNPTESHYGVDIVSNGDQIINATFDGTVVFASWSIENGYCIGIQHADGYFSTYKHNATLLKKEGDYVKAGEAIAILGESGETEHQEHLHFELWNNGIPVNPAEYMKLNIVPAN